MSFDVPEPSKGDVAHALTKAGLSVIPVVGGPAVELFQLLVQPPLERRRTAWMEQVGQKLLELEAQGLDLSKLQENEQFVTAVMQASSAAIRTHQHAKLDALKNAIIHIAIGEGPEETFQHILLGFIDEFSEMHFRVLAFAHAPVAPAGITMGSLSNVLEDNIPTLRGKNTLYNQIWQDLYVRGLVSTEGLNTTMSGNGLSQSRTSPIGVTLLNFISDS
ncbi:hypothetical protein ACFOLJ_27080 [Rugamonas sp. CCM 8940]|uniref:hypothetical protein n=1 Tax=Rugamonas sp. CCM 8940 TaxID=2765359 RepID=UPI0018F48698|nr:hypothetical protein [Rugamonas sp. CCM 8940]MBJ7313617.1 hypothetical protein [Rugamonas sp. CCM 8940]